MISWMQLLNKKLVKLKMMKKDKYYIGLSILVMLIVIAGCSNRIYNTAAQTGVRLSSTSPSAPVFKGMPTNQLLRLLVYVPADNPGATYKNIRCTLNKEGVDAIEKLDVYFTDSEPMFDVNNLIASVKPAVSLDIPVNLQLNPGMHYVWVGVTLKETANLDHQIEFHATNLIDSSGKAHPIVEDNSSYTKRLGVALRKANDDGVHTYRIPGIATTDKGTLIAVYDIRYKHSGDLPANIDVGMSRSIDGGKTWEPMKIIMDMGAPHENNGIGDPAVLFDPITNKIWVAALWSKGNRSIAGSKPGLSPDETGQFVLVSSDDDGLTWSETNNITTQVKNPAWNIFFNGPGNGIAMKDGKLVFPAQYWDEKRMPHSTLIYSDDHGKTWKSGLGAKSNTTEAQIVETVPGTLMLNMRDNRGGFRSVATTKDLGQTWVEHHTSFNALPDPTCMASLIKANVSSKENQRDILFFSNVNSKTGRVNMTIKASLDLGESWKAANQLLIDERRLFGYSALTKIDNNTIGLLYEGERDLYFVRIPVSDVIR